MFAVFAVGDSPAYLASYPDFTPDTCSWEGSGGRSLHTAPVFDIQRALQASTITFLFLAEALAWEVSSTPFTH